MSKRKTFFEEFRWFIGIFIFFGVWSSWQNDKHKTLFIINSVFSIHSVFATFVSAIFVFDVINDNSLSNVIAYLLLLSVLATHLVIVMQSLFYRAAQMKLLDKFAYVDHLLNTKLNIMPSYRKQKREILVRIVIFSIALAIIHIGLIAQLYLFEFLDSYWYHNFYSMWIMRLRCIQMLFFVYLLKLRLKLLTKKMQEILDSSNSHDTNHRIDKAKTLSNSRNVIFVLDTETSNTKEHLFDRLLFLKQIYGELHEVCELINQTFGWSLLAIFTQSFIEFTSHSYWIFLGMENTSKQYPMSSVSMSLLIPIVLILSTLAYYCSSCARCVSFFYVF